MESIINVEAFNRLKSQVLKVGLSKCEYFYIDAETGVPQMCIVGRMAALTDQLEGRTSNGVLSRLLALGNGTIDSPSYEAVSMKLTSFWGVSHDTLYTIQILHDHLSTKDDFIINDEGDQVSEVDAMALIIDRVIAGETERNRLIGKQFIKQVADNEDQDEEAADAFEFDPNGDED